MHGKYSSPAAAFVTVVGVLLVDKNYQCPQSTEGHVPHQEGTIANSASHKHDLAGWIRVGDQGKQGKGGAVIYPHFKALVFGKLRYEAGSE